MAPTKEVQITLILKLKLISNSQLNPFWDYPEKQIESLICTLLVSLLHSLGKHLMTMSILDL